MIRKTAHRLAQIVMRIIRRLDRYYRDVFDACFQKPISAIAQFFINLLRPDEHLKIAEERKLPDEEEITQEVTDQMSRFLRQRYTGKVALRAGNTKTYGLVRGTFEILPGLADHLRVGLFKELQCYPAWIRFAGPGPLATPDIDNNGILSIGIKVMGVEGKKLSDDEKHTQDFLGISSPTFTTPNVAENLKLQREIYRNTPIWYFVNPFDSHILDAVMQGLYARTHANPLELRYYSCVPYLFGAGQAIKYCVLPRSGRTSSIPKNPSDDYLREAMAGTLSDRDVYFDFAIQFQKDAHRMPIEHAGVVWPERLSPFITVATLCIPSQQFDSTAQLAFARNLSFAPWHALPEHRPLGNQNRARKRIYDITSKLRQEMNRDERIEPTGRETFDQQNQSF